MTTGGVSPAGLAGGAGRAPLLGAAGVLDEPMLVVDLDGRADPEVGAAAARVERIGDAEAAMTAASAFHMGIAKFAGNGRAERTLQTQVLGQAHALPGAVADRRFTSNQEFRDHRDLVAAMRRMDLTLAQEIMERHSQESIRQTLEGLTQL